MRCQSSFVGSRPWIGFLLHPPCASILYIALAMLHVKSHDPVKMMLVSHFSFVERQFSITFSYLTKI